MRLLVLTFALIAISPAYSQECESVVALSKIVSTVVSDKDSVEQHASNFCNEYAKSSGKSSNSSFGASYKFLSASFGSSNASTEEVASKYCSASNNYSANRDAYKQYIESISPNAYSAYEQCLRMTKQDLRFNVNLASVLPSQFSMSVAFTSSVSGASNAKLAYSASEGIKCKWDNSADKTLKMPSGSSAILECARTDQTKKGYVTVVRSDATSSDPLTLPWQAYSKEGVPVDTLIAIQKSLSLLQGNISSITNDVSGLRREMNAAGERIKFECTRVVMPGQDATCPSGFIVTGCSAGMNKGSIDLNDLTCHTHQQVDWTQARCCRLVK